MIIPKVQRRYCRFCKKYTEQTVTEAKRKPRKKNSRSQRRFMRKMKGYGSFPRQNPKGREKPTKKLDLRYKCAECKKTQSIGTGFRVKKFEIRKE
ncbi:MAG: 50S ribosomal protein L44e [Candidatus Aenigmarchaeota archaeon]|nr:50S ribosomal protein L44e [Candidatus Aenigmarchaeota archaeon]